MGAQHLLRHPGFKPAAPASGLPFTDTFTGTDEDPVTGRTGWATYTTGGFNSAWKLKNNRAYGSSSSIVQTTASAPGNDFTVTVPFRCVSADAIAGVIVCVDEATDSFYRALYVALYGGWIIDKWVVQDTHDLAGPSTWAPTPGQDYQIDVVVSATAIVLKIDGVTHLTGADSSLARAKPVGLFSALGPTSTTCLHADSFTLGA